ncbi:DUF3309 family protein [Muricoccus aerilatus]|uniref:DUF3309 family protein n=1 Tax=Muricoccus aerilatus TaxID=452982 RepID=UPI0012EC396B
MCRYGPSGALGFILLVLIVLLLGTCKKSRPLGRPGARLSRRGLVQTAAASTSRNIPSGTLTASGRV